MGCSAPGVEDKPHVLEAVELKGPLHGICVALYVEGCVAEASPLLRQLVQAVVAVDLRANIEDEPNAWLVELKAR